MFDLEFDEKKCLHCPSCACLTKCLYMTLDKDSAKMEINKIINDRESPVLQDCVLCYACEEYCEFGNHPMFLISELLEEKNLPVIPIEFLETLRDSYDPFRQDLEIRRVNESVLSMCWDPQLVDILIRGRIFEGLDIMPDMDSQRHFACQAIYLHTGTPSLTKKYLPKILQNFADHDVKEVICFHDECYGIFTSYAPAIGLEVPFKPIHLFEFLYGRMKELKDEITPLNVRAAYQRPCSSRLSTDTLHYVDDIFKLIGVESVKREFTGEKALCCGAAIRDQTRKGRSELAKLVQRKNISDMVDAESDICVFNCPHCFETLGEQVAQKGIKPIFMSNLCSLALGERPRDYGFHLPLEIRGEISIPPK